MDIKTKFSVDDTVYFLTTTDRILRFGDNHENKPYVCEGIVTGIDIAFKYKELVITYSVKVRNSNKNDSNYEYMSVEENWCAPDLVQLGLNVTNRFKVISLNPPKKKKNDN